LQTEPGYVIWDFKGLQLVQTNVDSLKQFVWRPRPRPLLSKDHQKRVRKNLKEFSRQFEEEDQLEESNVSAELLAHRKRLVEEWNAWRRKRRGEIEEERKRLGRDVPLKLSIKDKTKESEKEVVEEWVEEIIEEKEEEILP
jgi:translation initiation factor 3 subunit B